MIIKKEFKNISSFESNYTLTPKEITNILAGEVPDFNIKYPAYIFCKVVLDIKPELTDKIIPTERNIIGTWIYADIALAWHISKIYKKIHDEYTIVNINSITLKHLFNKKLII